MNVAEPKKSKEMRPAYEIIALMDARGMSNGEISEATGYNANYIWRIRNETEGYAITVAEFKREIRERAIDSAVDLTQKFNDHAGEVADNILNIALAGDKESNRLKASQDWLDRSTDAPKRVSRSEQIIDRNIIFSVKQIDNMKQGLLEVGQEEIVDLLEGEGYVEAAFDAPDEPNVINLDEEE